MCAVLIPFKEYLPADLLAMRRHYPWSLKVSELSRKEQDETIAFLFTL